MREKTGRASRSQILPGATIENIISRPETAWQCLQSGIYITMLRDYLFLFFFVDRLPGPRFAPAAGAE